MLIFSSAIGNVINKIIACTITIAKSAPNNSYLMVNNDVMTSDNRLPEILIAINSFIFFNPLMIDKSTVLKLIKINAIPNSLNTV